MTTALTSQQIAIFEKAMRGPSPDYDPNWTVTQQLIKLTVVQSKQILELQAQLDAYLGANQASSTALLDALQQCARVPLSKQSLQLQPAQAKLAINELNKAMKSYKNGQQVMSYAASVLKFAAVLLI